MKYFLITLASLLLVGFIVVALIMFGPLQGLLPQSEGAPANNPITDYFTAGSRTPVAPSTGNDNTPFGTPTQTGTTTPNITWTLPGMTSGTTVLVRPFVVSTTTESTASDLPTKNVFVVPTSTTTPYTITYFAHDRSFMVSLTKEPLADARKAAEQQFMQILGITQTDACNLKYAVSVPSFVNTFYAGKNLGFSFCPGATPL